MEYGTFNQKIKAVPPVVNPARPGEQLHPAFGCVTVGRSQVGGGAIFGSDILHESLITVRLLTAYQTRDFHENKHQPLDLRMEFTMSESQWSHMLSTTNSYSGTPVTFTRLQPCNEAPQSVPGIVRENMAEKFEQEITEKTREFAKQVKNTAEELRVEVDAAKQSKKSLKRISDQLNNDVSLLVANTVFIQKMLSAQLEKKVGEAKVEMEAYFNRRAAELKTIALHAEKLEEA